MDEVRAEPPRRPRRAGSAPARGGGTWVPGARYSNKKRVRQGKETLPVSTVVTSAGWVGGCMVLAVYALLVLGKLHSAAASFQVTNVLGGYC